MTVLSKHFHNHKMRRIQSLLGDAFSGVPTYQTEAEYFQSIKSIIEEPMNHCAFCKEKIEGEVLFSIHRDGFGEGPEVPLCEGCGNNQTPTCEEIWQLLAKEEAKQSAYWKEP